MRLTTAVILIWLILLAGVFALPFVSKSPAVGEDLTRATVWIALLFYFVAASKMLWLDRLGWLGKTPEGRLARCCWTLGWATFVIHVGVAFHFYHHWSHAAAVEHVRERSGVGEGIFVSYLFTLAWTIDVAWWWLRPASYGNRPRWIDGVLHAFMFFMVFAATVIYGEGPVRWVGVLICGTLFLGVVMQRVYRPRSMHSRASLPR
jgi:hypothetical protein